jgi:hypothetical protein
MLLLPAFAPPLYCWQAMERGPGGEVPLAQSAEPLYTPPVHERTGGVQLRPNSLYAPGTK